jgi:hypothetical protein
MLKNAFLDGKRQMEDGKTPVFSRSFPFPIYHVPFRPAFFSGLGGEGPRSMSGRLKPAATGKPAVSGLAG